MSYSFGVANLILVLSAVGGAAATLPTGYMVDKVGRKFVLIAGPCLAAAASLLTAQAHSFPELLVYRFIAGWAMLPRKLPVEPARMTTGPRPMTTEMSRVGLESGVSPADAPSMAMA